MKLCVRLVSRDPIEEIGGLNLYGFVRNNPVNLVDVLGLAQNLQIQVVQKAKRLSDCGSCEYKVKWKITDSSKSGWVVQHLKWDVDVKDCKGNPVSKPKNPKGLEFWEGWQVEGGQVYIGFKDAAGSNKHQVDTFRTGDEGEGTKGTITITGKVKFWENYNLTVPPWGYTVPEAGSLPTVKPPGPSGWNTQNTLDHTLVCEWKCCPCEKRKPTECTGSP